MDRNRHYRIETDIIPQTLGALELTGIARGYQVADKILKKAPVRLLEARAYCPGRFFIVLSGDVSSVREAIAEGETAAGTYFFGKLIIPNLSMDIFPAINREIKEVPGESLGVVESLSAVGAIDGADAGIKGADVALESINLLRGLGGKAFTFFSGRISDVSAAVEAALGRIPPDMRVGGEVISNVSRELIPFLPGRAL